MPTIEVVGGAPIIPVRGFWLGAWAWDEVADALRADGHDVTALTLRGLEAAEPDRSSITTSGDRRKREPQPQPTTQVERLECLHAGRRFHR